MFWLVKTDPETYSWNDLVRDGKTVWDGVRNFQARNFIKEMKQGDILLVYHSQNDKAIVGIAEVVSEPFPDPTTNEPHWLAIEVIPVEEFLKPVTLAQLKKSGEFTDFPLIRQSRLSVMPVKAEYFKKICLMGDIQPEEFFRA